MLRLTTFAGLFASLFTSAQALTFDFTQEPYQPPERAVADGTIVSDQGLDLVFSATRGLAYFDGPNKAGRVAGLGVCNMRFATVGEECSVPRKDNIRNREEVFVSFGFSGELHSVVLRNAKHFLLKNSSFMFSLDGGGSWLEGVTNVNGAVNLGGLDFSEEGLGFRFGGTSPKQFYVSTVTADINQIPLPMSGLLLVGALALLRRRKAC